MVKDFMDNSTGPQSEAAKQDDPGKIRWDQTTEEKFKQMIGKIPVFLRGIAQAKVSQKAESIVRKENRREVFEKDMVDAFFSETPFGFHGPMKSDMASAGIDYTKYGHPP